MGKHDDEVRLRQTKFTLDIPGDHVNLNCRDNYTKDVAELVIWAYYRAMRMNPRDAAEFYGLEPEDGVDLLYPVFYGKADAAQLDRATRAFARVREATGRNNGPRYANTKMARKIRNACDVALEILEADLPLSDARCVFVGADAGGGKSTVGQAFAADNNHGRTCYWQHPRVGGLKAQVQQLAILNNVNSYISYNDLTPRVARCFPRRILIIDDAHKLVEGGKKDLPKLEYFLGLHDTQPMVLVFLAAMDKFGRALGDTHYNDRQFWRRCQHIEIVDEPADEDDIRALFKFKCPAMEMTDKLLAKLGDINAHDEGRFGTVAQVFTRARILAKQEGARMTPAHLFVAASKQLEQLQKIHAKIGDRRADRR